LHNRVLDTIAARDANSAEHSMRHLLSETLAFVSSHLKNKKRPRFAHQRTPSSV
jgi:DNA-binding GntR family transcriptional regulator